MAGRDDTGAGAFYHGRGAEASGLGHLVGGLMVAPAALPDYHCRVTRSAEVGFGSPQLRTDAVTHSPLDDPRAPVLCGVPVAHLARDRRTGIGSHAMANARGSEPSCLDRAEVFGSASHAPAVEQNPWFKGIATVARSFRHRPSGLK